MTKKQFEKFVELLAQRLGKLKDQKYIDENTRKSCIDVVERTIQSKSNVLFKNDDLAMFRENAKFKEHDNSQNLPSDSTKEG